MGMHGERHLVAVAAYYPEGLLTMPAPAGNPTSYFINRLERQATRKKHSCSSPPTFRVTILMVAVESYEDGGCTRPVITAGFFLSSQTKLSCRVNAGHVHVSSLVGYRHRLAHYQLRPQPIKTACMTTRYIFSLIEQVAVDFQISNL
jgi:hypothetical protein